MHTVSIYKAKKHLSQLVKAAAQGKPFIITKAGKPLVKVTALNTPANSSVQRIGFMSGEIKVPDDFDHMDSLAIEHLT